MFHISPSHLIIVLVIALLVLGPKRLPEVGRSLGRGLREFKESVGNKIDDSDEDTSLHQLESKSTRN